MVNIKQRDDAELLGAYRDYLLSKVGKVRILGEANERELKDVFVELSIADQREPQYQAEFLGMVEPTFRPRFNTSQAQFADITLKLSEQYEAETKRRVKVGELLRRKTKAIVTGAPGCGKTTLFKYLALQAQEKEKRLVIWFELKAIYKPLFAQAEKAAAHNSSLILQELWLNHVKAQLSLSNGEIKLLRKHWQENFKAHEIAVFLDGFDELQDEMIEHSLNKCVREFASSPYNNTLLISTRPYAQHKLGNERLQELKIEPLNQRQLAAFLNSYYPDDAVTKSFLRSVSERSSFRELLRAPLLLGVILRLYKENRLNHGRLELYETIIADLVHELDRSKSVTRQFNIKDERLRLDFLEFLAFERLLRDPLDEEGQEVNRIVFSYDLLKEKARTFLAQERLTHNARDLADDALATPLLREVRARTFAFTHLALQEYLAARAFAAFHKGNEFEGLKIFCRAYHNPTIVEMEALPMMLGATINADKLYAEIECWPESLTFANLRLRARGWAYRAKISQQLQTSLISRLLECVREWMSDEAPYRQLIVESFDGIEKAESALVSLLREDEDLFVRGRAAEALGEAGAESAVTALLSSLAEDPNEQKGAVGVFKNHVRIRAVDALGRIGSERAIDALILTLRTDKDSAVVIKAGKALGLIGSERAVDDLLAVLLNRECRSTYVLRVVAQALGRIGSERAIDPLVIALQDEAMNLRAGAASGLGLMGSERAIDALLPLLHDENAEVRWNVAESLGRIGSERAVSDLLHILFDGKSFAQDAAAQVLGRIGSERAVDPLLAALHSKDDLVRQSACQALGRIGSERAIDALLTALHDRYMEVRWAAAEALGQIGSERALNALIEALQDKDTNMRKRLARAFGRIGSESAVDALLTMLHDPPVVEELVVQALGRIGSERAVSTLLPILCTGDSAVNIVAAEAFTKFKPGILARGLTQALYQDAAFVRRKAAQVIGYYSTCPSTLQELLRLAENDTDKNVLDAAKESAKKFLCKLRRLGHFVAEGAAKPLGDNESRELFLVGEAFKVVAESGHIFRPTPNSDWGIDGEIEFKNERGEATGRRVYLQLKSGDSYLRTRKRDGKEIFTIKARHAEYWQSHAYPVLLVIRNVNGQIRWMDVTEYLRRHGTSVKQIEFQGEPFTAESVKQMCVRSAHRV